MVEREVVVTADAADTYTYRFELSYMDGTREQSEGRGILYTGYEWRGTGTHGDEEIREVYQVAEDGRSASGRWFLADADSIGGRIEIVKDEGSMILALEPTHLRAGESGEISIFGTGLQGDVDLGEGVSVDEVVSRDADMVVVRVSAADDAPVGLRTVSVGDTAGENLLAVYDELAEVTVEPPYNIARVGGGGGPIPEVPAAFEAIGWAETDAGNLRLGRMPATFEVENLDEVAEAMNDAKFAGTMEPRGLFRPAEAGLNPERPYETNNAGVLKVIATVEDDGVTRTGEGQLLVTVQRWNDPPIR